MSELLNTTAHDDFDWSVDKKNVVKYNSEDHKKYEETYENTITQLSDHQIVPGKVVAVTMNDVVLSVGFKSDGLVPISEFRDDEGLAVGNIYDVYVISKENKDGHLLLSRRNAKLLKAWERIVEANQTGEIVTGRIISKTKGGLIANIFGLETFLPGSQIDVKPITDYDIYVGKTLELKVVKINEAIKNAVVSHKALIESDIENQREAIISKLEKGQVLEGTIKNITDFGAFIDLGGVDGLLYITDISWGRITHPNEVLQLNQKLNVVVLEFDDNKKRISLGLKQLQPHPWDTLDNGLEVGAKVTGKIVNIEDYGAFLEITPGVEGLIHVSEVSWSTTPTNSRDFFKLGDTHEAVVMTLDREERKMSLSIKRLTEDPWSKVAEQFPIGTKTKGVVKNLTPYGVFVELGDGVGGMVHISDLSWTKRYNHPSEFTKVGNELDVVVLGIDNENRKLTLGHKQIEEDPWDTFENVFPVGSVHEATVLSADDKGAVVLLPYGLEGFAPKKHTAKEQGGYLAADEKAEFKVLEFNRNDKRILLSHARLWEEAKHEQVESAKAEKKAESEKASKKVKEIQKSIEKSTFGDLSVLSDLKDKMEGKTPAKKAAVKETPAADLFGTASPLDGAKEAMGKKVTQDDLKLVEGIGPKIEELFHNAGIKTWADLAAANADNLKEILAAGGDKYKMHDPTTWPAQADMMQKGQWIELKKYQDELDGGRAAAE